MAVRRLELTNEQLRNRVANLMVRLSQKDDLINKMRSGRADSEPLANPTYGNSPGKNATTKKAA
jgi:hypothetical protein